MGTGAITGTPLGSARVTSPWDAILGEVTRSQDMVNRLQVALNDADSDADVAPKGRLHWAWKALERETRWLGRVSKMAIDAGVAERLVHRVELDANAIVGVLIRAINAADLNDAQQIAVRTALAAELAAMHDGVPLGLPGGMEPLSDAERLEVGQSA